MIGYNDEENSLNEEKNRIMSNPYIGKERRIQERRINANERRELVRYEINKEPRRSGKDRRKVNGWAEYSDYKLM